VYPPIEPYERGRLPVGDGHELYWETCGDPAGRPALVLHGGPGSGCTPRSRRLFDPQRYRVVLFDQRGAGRSTPHASEPDTDLATNTTQHLLADIEALREHLGVERWLVYGVSWGTTLGLAYAQRHPDRVLALVLASVVTTTAREVQWVTRDMGRVFPAQWARLRAGAGSGDGDLVDSYARLLTDPDPAVRERAAADWCAWEDTHVATVPGYRPDPRYDDPRFRMGFARLVTHYWRHHAWLSDGELERNVSRLAGIPGVLVQGQLDISGPPDVAWRLAQAWPSAELVIVGGAGHGTGEATVTSTIVAALDRFAAA
jgi:proline iminopeptidase